MSIVRFGLIVLTLPLAAVALTAGCATDLHRAAENNSSPSSVKRALDGGADPNVRNEFGSTPLHIAMGADADTELVKVLVEGGADVNAVNDDGETPLHEAAWFSDNTAKVELLLDGGADTEIKDNRGNTPLHRAAAHGEPEIIELLLDYGADINAINDSGKSPLYESLTTRQIFIEDGLDVARLLLERGANPGGHVLWNFATPGIIVDGEQDMGDPEIVALLLEYGADPTGTNTGGVTLLHIVASVEIARLLVDAGADVNAADNPADWTPLHAAVGSGDRELIELYLDSGADIEAQDSNGQTPLKTAILAQNLNLDIIELLLDRGADPFAEHYGIATPCRSARSFDTITDPAILERLCSGGGSRTVAAETPTPTPTPQSFGLAAIAASAIHMAVITESPDLVAALLDDGVPIEVATTITLTDGRRLHGVTLLHVAVFNRDTAMIELLLDRGADINAMTATGDTPCDLGRQIDTLAGTATLDRLCGD